MFLFFRRFPAQGTSPEQGPNFFNGWDWTWLTVQDSEFRVLGKTELIPRLGVPSRGIKDKQIHLYKFG